MRDIRINYMRVKSAVIGKFRTVGACVERLEWLPGAKNKVTLTIMSKRLQGEWLGRSVGNCGQVWGDPDSRQQCRIQSVGTKSSAGQDAGLGCQPGSQE